MHALTHTSRGKICRKNITLTK